MILLSKIEYLSSTNFEIKKIIILKNKHLLLLPLLLVAFLVSCNKSKKGAYDPKALSAIDSLGVTIGNLNSCSFSLSTNIGHHDSGKVRMSYILSQVYMRGPDKMYIYSVDSSSRKGYYYNGSKLSLYSFDDQKYETIKAPSQIIEVIDSVHKTFGIDFPASDFFYPTLTTDLMNDFDTIAVSGSTSIDGLTCKEINAISAEKNVFISIDESTNLPKRLEIYYLGDKKGESYSITFYNWKTNPVLPDLLFSFAPPPSAIKSSLFVNKTDQ
jgi:hypothetical protein